MPLRNRHQRWLLRPGAGLVPRNADVKESITKCRQKAILEFYPDIVERFRHHVQLLFFFNIPLPDIISR